MMMNDLDDQGLAAVAFLIEIGRQHTAGADGWDRAGIVGALRTAEGKVETVLGSALAAASDPAARTPIAITWDKYRQTSEAPAAERGPSCVHCGRSRYACDRAQRNTGQDRHEFRPQPVTTRREHP